MSHINIGNCQIIFWPRVFPLLSIRKWRDPYNSQIGLWFSVNVGPIEFRFWKLGRRPKTKAPAAEGDER